MIVLDFPQAWNESKDYLLSSHLMTSMAVIVSFLIHRCERSYAHIYSVVNNPGVGVGAKIRFLWLDVQNIPKLAACLFCSSSYYDHLPWRILSLEVRQNHWWSIFYIVIDHRSFYNPCICTQRVSVFCLAQADNCFMCDSFLTMALDIMLTSYFVPDLSWRGYGLAKKVVSDPKTCAE